MLLADICLYIIGVILFAGWVVCTCSTIFEFIKLSLKRFW